MIKPLGDRVVIEPIDKEETTASGIVLPDTAKEKPQEGKVVAVGSGTLHDGERIPVEVKEGDRVFFHKIDKLQNIGTFKEVILHG